MPVNVMREGSEGNAKLMHHAGKASFHRAMGRAHHNLADEHEQKAATHAEKIAKKIAPPMKGGKKSTMPGIALGR